MIAGLLFLLLLAAPTGAHNLQPADKARCEAVSAEHPIAVEIQSRELFHAEPPKVGWTEFRGGCAVLTFQIDAAGAVSDVDVLFATDDRIGKAAQRAATEWRYAPGPAGQGGTIVFFDLSSNDADTRR